MIAHGERLVGNGNTTIDVNGVSTATMDENTTVVLTNARQQPTRCARIFFRDDLCSMRLTWSTRIVCAVVFVDLTSPTADIVEELLANVLMFNQSLSNDTDELQALISSCVAARVLATGL